jgi:uncharacterized membrane protein YraQ (UPF0718 family)
MLSIFTDFADWAAYSLFGLAPGSKLGGLVQFFIEDTTKIFFLLVLMIYVIALIRAEKLLQPFVLKAYHTAEVSDSSDSIKPRLSLKGRHDFAKVELLDILGSGQWWSVPVAVLAGIPLYSNATGVIPLLERLIAKGLPLGTTLAFCMSTVAVQVHVTKNANPEALLTYRVMSTPAVVVEGQLIHSCSVSDKTKIETWLK